MGILHRDGWSEQHRGSRVPDHRPEPQKNDPVRHRCDPDQTAAERSPEVASAITTGSAEPIPVRGGGNRLERRRQCPLGGLLEQSSLPGDGLVACTWEL
jgi:hypothetical protein